MKRRARGQSIVELALIMPFLVLITIGTMELSYYIYSYSELENAARRAAEWSSTTPPYTATTSDDVSTSGSPDKCALLIKNAAIEGVFMSKLKESDITITYPDSDTRDRGERVQVQLQYTGNWLTPIGRQFFGPFLKFNFIARRTIVSVDPPPGKNADCSDK